MPFCHAVSARCRALGMKTSEAAYEMANDRKLVAGRNLRRCLWPAYTCEPVRKGVTSRHEILASIRSENRALGDHGIPERRLIQASVFLRIGHDGVSVVFPLEHPSTSIMFDKRLWLKFHVHSLPDFEEVYSFEASHPSCC